MKKVWYKMIEHPSTFEERYWFSLWWRYHAPNVWDMDLPVVTLAGVRIFMASVIILRGLFFLLRVYQVHIRIRWPGFRSEQFFYFRVELGLILEMQEQNLETVPHQLNVHDVLMFSIPFESHWNSFFLLATPQHKETKFVSWIWPFDQMGDEPEEVSDPTL